MITLSQSNPAALLQGILVASLLLGVVTLFLGYRLWTLLLALFGIGVGAWALLLLMASGAELGAAVAIGLFTAAIAATLFAAVRPIGTFVVGGFTAAGVAIQVLSSLGGIVDIDPDIVLPTAGGVLVLGGFITAAAGRKGIIVASSIGGAQSVVACGLALAETSDLGMAKTLNAPFGALEFVLWGVAAGIGMAFQLSTTQEELIDPGSLPTAQPHDPQSSATHGIGLIAGEAPRVVAGPEPTIEAQLEHLDSLLKDGLITEQEHENARRQVLANI